MKLAHQGAVSHGQHQVAGAQDDSISACLEYFALLTFSIRKLGSGSTNSVPAAAHTCCVRCRLTLLQVLDDQREMTSYIVLNFVDLVRQSVPSVLCGKAGIHEADPLACAGMPSCVAARWQTERTASEALHEASETSNVRACGQQHAQGRCMNTSSMWMSACLLFLLFVESRSITPPEPDLTRLCLSTVQRLQTLCKCVE